MLLSRGIITILILFIACSCARESRPILKISGSTTLSPLAKKWASEFSKQYGIDVSYDASESGHGIKQLEAGQVDLAASSRELTTQEQNWAEEIPVAQDALVFIVHPDNPVKAVKTEQLQDVFMGDLNNWKALGGLNQSIYVISRGNGSGSRSTFLKSFICYRGHRCPALTEKALQLHSNSQVRYHVRLNKRAIGYISYSWLDKSVVPLSIDGFEIEDFQRGIPTAYPFARELVLVRQKGIPSPMVKAFLNFILSDRGQTISKELGFFPIYAQSALPSSCSLVETK